MEQLDEVHVERIWQTLVQHGKHEGKLAEEILDHLCCFVEQCLGKGLSFEESVTRAFQAVVPEGLDTIQHDLQELLAQKSSPEMKRVFYIFCFVCSFCLSLSMLSRHWHIAEATYWLTTLGNLALLLGVLPAVARMAYQNLPMLTTWDKARMGLGLVSGLLIAIGMIFKSNSFPFSNELFSLGILTFCFLFLPLFFYQLYRRTVL